VKFERVISGKQGKKNGFWEKNRDHHYNYVQRKKKEKPDWGMRKPAEERRKVNQGREDALGTKVGKPRSIK